MRLHHLEATAFGPFADRVRVDFDALSDAGLFLLSGPTGAGKSSVLDAVCFALYGDVPGDRSAAKRLRSDHAAPDVVPRVVLEATLSGRRFRIDRSPAWTRPKKRGTGTTTEQARVVISERRTHGDGGAEEWLPLSTRLDETGHLVTRLVGMTLPQFCQVALLPQGRFQAFLRARSEERHALLQQVFQTGRFDRTERWLRDRRVELRRASEAHQHTVADLVSRISEVGGDAAPAAWQDAPAGLGTWVSALGATAATAATAQAAKVETAAAAEASASGARAAGIELAERQAAHAAAHREWSAVVAATPEHDGRRQRADRGQRAAAVRPLHELAIEAGRTADDLADRATAALEALAGLHEGVELDDQRVAELQRDATRRLTDLARVRPLERQAHDVEDQLVGIDRTRELTAAEVSLVDKKLDTIPSQLEQLGPDLTAAREAAARVPSLTGDLETARARVRAARSAASLTEELAAAEAALGEARRTRLVAREVLVEIRERRLDGMAAEIAGKLAVGADCPVCGSAEHPHPAAPAPGAPDESTEREARREVDDLEVVVEAHAQQARGLEKQLAATLAEAGDSVEHLLAEEESALALLERTRGVADGLDALTARESGLRADLQAAGDRRAELAEASARHDTEAAVLAARLADLRVQVAAVVPGDTDLDTLVAHHQQVERLARDQLGLAADLARARATATKTQEAADEVAVRAGFADSATADASWLAESDLVDLQERIVRHEREAARVQALLADEELTRAGAVAAPDLDALADAHQHAQEDLATARQAQAAAHERRRRLDGLAQEVAAALAAWAPVRDDLDLAADLSSLVEGKHPDNHLQMRLSAYVLAHRLGQVVDAANLRLSAMSDQRYSLVHTGRRGAGETRGGLSLLVRDDWTGDSRDPATLSGGETFVVSLALALGLADVITDEAGGTDLDTLFVDEGFGSLDAETLEDVMDTLDTLRDGGRVIGVVSHVPELQTRIPTQLRVRRGRRGSSLALHLG
jgi:DNA repair protein SbcC/Rad50